VRHIDKAHHFFWSLGLAAIASFFVGPGWGVVIAALIGLVKEVWDGLPPRRRFDVWDLLANAIGLITAWVVIG